MLPAGVVTGGQRPPLPDVEDPNVTQTNDQGAEPTAEQVADARAAYAAYGETTGGKNFRGEPMPDWDGLGETIQRAWVAAAATVRQRAAPIAGDGDHEQVCEWLRANGIDPDDVPADAQIDVQGERLTVDVVVRNAEGHTIAAGSGYNGVLRTKRTVPLVVPFPGW